MVSSRIHYGHRFRQCPYEQRGNFECERHGGLLFGSFGAVVEEEWERLCSGTRLIAACIYTESSEEALDGSVQLERKWGVNWSLMTVDSRLPCAARKSARPTSIAPAMCKRICQKSHFMDSWSFRFEDYPHELAFSTQITRIVLE